LNFFVLCFKDPAESESWWLHVGDEVIGYWPGSILHYLRQSAIVVQWGGDVYSKKVKGSKPHTVTAMGSGQLVSRGSRLILTSQRSSIIPSRSSKEIYDNFFFSSSSSSFFKKRNYLDVYQTTGCINHICSGFVQTSLNMALGGALLPLSTKSGL
jgi:hypothetical protein